MTATKTLALTHLSMCISKTSKSGAAPTGKNRAALNSTRLV